MSRRGTGIGAVALAFVAPAGGANPGDGVIPVPAYTAFVIRLSSPPPEMKAVSGGGGEIRRPPHCIKAGQARTA